MHKTHKHTLIPQQSSAIRTETLYTAAAHIANATLGSVFSDKICYNALFHTELCSGKKTSHFNINHQLYK